MDTGATVLQFNTVRRIVSDCIINDTRPLTTSEDGRDFLEIILAGYQSLQQGRTIELSRRR